MRVTTLLLVFLTLCTISFATDSFYIDKDGWCRGLEIPFTVYNQSEWNEKEEIKDDEDRNFSKLHIEVTVYDGPFDISEPLYNKEFKKVISPTFKITFEEEKPYLIEIKPKAGNFTSYKETFEVRSCKAIEKKIETKQTHNISTSYDSNIKLDIKNSNIEDISQFQIQKEEETKFNLEDSYILYSISGPQNFSGEVILTLPYNNSNDSELEVFLIDEETQELIPVSSYSIEENNVIIETDSLGTYSIYQEKSISVEEIVESQEEKIEKVKKPREELEEKTSPLDLMNIILIGIVLVMIMIFAPKLFSSKTQKQTFHEERKKETKQQISSSQEAYKKTKEYVQKYKTQYSRDAIKSALKTSKVSEEIIELVFSEEY